MSAKPVKDSKSALRRDRGGTRPIRRRRCSSSLTPACGAFRPCEDGFLCRHIFHSDRSPCRRCIWAWSCRPRSMPHRASVIGSGPDVAHQPHSDPRTATQATASALQARTAAPRSDSLGSRSSATHGNPQPKAIRTRSSTTDRPASRSCTVLPPSVPHHSKYSPLIRRAAIVFALETSTRLPRLGWKPAAALAVSNIRSTGVSRPS